MPQEMDWGMTQGDASTAVIASMHGTCFRFLCIDCATGTFSKLYEQQELENAKLEQERVDINGDVT
jgi:hypothetical protein